MTRRNENSVLFSLGHLQQMAMASAGNARLSGPRPLGTGPIMTAPADLPYMPVSVASSTLMMAPRASWPRWLAPVIIGLGTLFIVFLVLALAIALRTPEVKVKPSIIPPHKAQAPALVTVKKEQQEQTEKTTEPAEKPAAEPPTAAPAAPIPAATETAALPDPAPKKPEPRASKARSKKAKRRAALRRRARARKRARARARARARKRRAQTHKRRTARRVASSTTPYKKKLGDAELDAILNVR